MGSHGILGACVHLVLPCYESYRFDTVIVRACLGEEVAEPLEGGPIGEGGGWLAHERPHIKQIECIANAMHA